MSAGAVSPAIDEIALVDLLDRLLAGGVVLAGDITISLAGIDLVHVSLRALISSVDTLTEAASSSMGDVTQP